MADNIPYMFVGLPVNPYAEGYSSDTLEENAIDSGESIITTTTNEYTGTFIDSRVEPGNPIVHDEALRFAGSNDGSLTIGQICSIYHYIRFGDSSTKGWIYKSDPRGADYFAYANETLKIGEETGCTGTGDCDDFAILMSALIESIGGTTRIIKACDNDGSCHAYTEVYLGELNDDKTGQLDQIIPELQKAYHANIIYAHIDLTTWDVWLNLDWGSDHPGGKIFDGNVQSLSPIGDQSEKTSVSTSSIDTASSLAESAIDLLYFQHNPDAAIQACDQAINYNRGEDKKIDFEAFYIKGYALYQQDKYEDAILAYDNSINSDPTDWCPWNGKQDALNALGRYSEAEAVSSDTPKSSRGLCV